VGERRHWISQISAFRNRPEKTAWRWRRPADARQYTLGRLEIGQLGGDRCAVGIRRASRSLTFVFSALIWSNIVGVVVGMVAFSGFRSIGMINLAGV
jgi:hypothetical protein